MSCNAYICHGQPPTQVGPIFLYRSDNYCNWVIIYETLFEQLFYVSGPPTQFVLIRGLSVGAVHCRGGFFTHYTARFTRCNFLHRSISWPIRCQGAGLRPASPCIVCLTKWALCGRGSRGAIITLPTLTTTASSPWLRREQERWRDMIDDSTPPHRHRHLHLCRRKPCLPPSEFCQWRVSEYHDANADGKPRLL